MIHLNINTDWVVKAVADQLNYFLGFHENVEKLEAKKEELTRERDRLQREIEGADRQLQAIEEGVRDCQSKADEILTDVESMETEIERDERCFNCCPNWWWRYRLSNKLAKKTLPEISGILEKMAKFGEPGRVGYRSSSTLPNIKFLLSKDFMVSKSSSIAFNQIMEALQAENVSVVGLWGMGGVGKTTLVHQVGSNVENLFDKVVVATVSQKPSFEKIQDDIAKFLGFDMKNGEGRRSAEGLYLRLQKEKRVLIILDDVWSVIDLKKIGIPLGEDHKGCKVLLTTRRMQVCNSMECQKAVPLGCLDDQEAWELFEMKAGLKDSSDDAIREVATEVMKKCEGLPIAIVTLGSALKGKTLAQWDAAYRRLQRRGLMEIEDIDLEEREKNAYLCLEASFGYLRDMGTKKCFLLCSLYPEDYEVDVEDLVRYAWGLELFNDIDSIEEMRSEVHAAIDTLKDSCLLLGGGERHVKMHDMVRDVALWIASSNKEISFMIKSEVEFKKWPKNESFEPYTAISLKVSKNDVLPERLVCPNLKMLLLKADFCRIPEAFFEGMEALKVCTLQYGSLFPNASRFQMNIRTLLLKGCGLEDISSLGKFKELQILSLYSRDINDLPDEIGELNDLRLLDLTDCAGLQRIPPNVIRKLTQLEELHLGSCRLIKWATEKLGEKESNASLSELLFLSNLSVLSLEISPEHLPKGFLFPKLQRYDLCIIKDVRKVMHENFLYGEFGKNKFSRSLKIEAFALNACKLLLGNVEWLYLRDLVGCQNLVPSLEFDQGAFSKLSSLTLTSCEGMNYLIDTTKQQAPTVAFSNLVKLSLRNMSGLEELCYGHQPQGFLQKLKILSLRNCKEMISPLPILENLENLEVESCDKMEVIFQGGPSHHGSCRSLKVVKIRNCKEMISPLPILENLENLKVESCDNMQVIFQEGPSHHGSCRSLKVVEIESCHKITYLFPSSVAKSLGQLERLVINDCLGLEEIIISEAEMSNICLQSLREVHVSGCNKLGSLSSLSHGQILENLRQLTIHNCSQLEYTFPISMAEALPQLNVVCLSNLPSLQELEVTNLLKLTTFIDSAANIQELSLEGMAERKELCNMKVLRLIDLPKLRVIWKSPIEVVNFRNLEEFRVNHCKSLRYIFSATIARNLTKLRDLNILDCWGVEQIIDKDETSSQDPLQPICFPSLSDLYIGDCENIKSLFFALRLPKLEYIALVRVPRLEQIFEQGDEANFSEEQEEVMIKLPQLKSIWLSNAPGLLSFSPVGYHLIFPSLEHLEVTKCPKMTTSFAVDSDLTVHAKPKAHQQIDDQSIMEDSAAQTTWTAGSDISWFRRA